MSLLPNVLSNHPLSLEFRTKIERRLNTAPRYVSISELRHKPLAEVLKILLNTTGELFITAEDDSWQTVLPVLEVLSAFSRASSIHLLTPELVKTRVHRGHAVASAIGVMTASVRNQLATSRASVQMAKLLREPRLTARPQESRDVLYVNANLWFGVNVGGSVSHISGVANALEALGRPVTYVATCDNPLLSPAIKRSFLRAPKTMGFPPPGNHYYFDATVTKQLAAIEKTAPFGLIYQRLSLGNYTGVKLSRKLGLPLILEYNGSEAYMHKKYGRQISNHATAEMAEDVCLRHAHVVVTISEVLKEELLSRGVEEERIVCYPNCIDPARFDPATLRTSSENVRASLGIAPDALLFSAISTFAKYHGMDFLASAIVRLASAHRSWLDQKKIHFLFVGDGLTKLATERIIRDAGLAGLCTFTGVVKQALGPAYMAASDVLLTPHLPNPDGSKFIGSPIKLFEYLASGKAIIGSDLDQLGKVLCASIRPPDFRDDFAPQQEVGILTQPGNEWQFIEALRFIADRPDCRQRLGANARSEALAKYTWKIHTELILERATKLGLL